MAASTCRILVYGCLAAGLSVFMFANAHLLYVAFGSQPDCVAHIRRGDGPSADKGYAAAKSDCTPGRPRLEAKEVKK